MTESTRSPQLTLDEMERQTVELVNQLAPRNLQADAVVCPCESECRPVYPVRYAYSNLYGDKNAKAAMPPPINKLLELCPAQPDIEIYEAESCSIEDTNGFSARLLRSGWVYVFEEGEYPTRIDTKGNLLIFQHVISYAHNGQVYDENDRSDEASAAIEAGDADEFFIPHTRIYNVESQAWELQAQFPYYPYLAIKKDVFTARFFFSDTQLSDYTLKKMATDAIFRESFMQEINLVDFNNNLYALEANEDHLNRLVEEYKDENIRFSAFVEQAKKIGATLPGGGYFAEITNIPNITKGSQALLQQIKSSLDYTEKSSLVILHDPVGYQKDILSLYSFITTAYTVFQNQWSYPNQVGHYLQSIKIHLDHPDISQTGSGYHLREQFLDNIDINGWETYWPEIELAYNEFEELQSNILRLYCDFLSHPSVKNEVGGIKNYIDHVFLIREQYEQGDFWHSEFFEEVKHYCEFHEFLLSPLNSSKSGQQALDLLFSVDISDGEIWQSLSDIVINLVSEEELRKGGEHYLNALLPALQSTLLICWGALGHAVTQIHTELKHKADGARFITQAGVDFLANKVLPAFLGFFGIRIDTEKLQSLSGKQFMDWMDSLNGKINLPNKMNTLLNWDAKLRNVKASPVFKALQYHYVSTGLPVDKDTFKNTGMLGFSVYSLLMGILELHAAKMTEYDRNDPLNAGAVNIFRMQMVIYLTNTAEGVITTRQAAGAYAKRVTYPPLKHILMKVSLPEAKSKLGKGAIKSAGYIVALLGVALPIVEGMAELDKKNYVAGNAKFTEAAATFVLSVGVSGVGKANAIINGAATLSRNPLMGFITRFAWQIVLLAVITLVISAVIYHLFKTDKFEELLKNCFWGNGSKYFAGGYKLSQEQKIDRPDTKEEQLELYLKHFDEYMTYYQMELQEFLNFFFTPTLHIASKGKITPGLAKNHYGGAHYRIQYQFKLTNFQYGLSDIEYQLIEPKPLFANQATVKFINRTVILLRDGVEYIASNNADYNAKFERALSSALKKASPNEGVLELNFEVDAGILAGDPLKNQVVPSLHWYYVIDRIKGEIAPLRYKGANLQEKIYGYIDDEGME